VNGKGILYLSIPHLVSTACRNIEFCESLFSILDLLHMDKLTEKQIDMVKLKGSLFKLLVANAPNENEGKKKSVCM
jgi:hypothetical protein